MKKVQVVFVMFCVMLACTLQAQETELSAQKTGKICFIRSTGF